MEFPAYLALTLLCGWILYWSTANSRRKPGTPITGLFVYRDEEEPQTPAMKLRDTPSGQWTGLR